MLGELFKEMGKSYNEDLNLKAIWLSNPVMTLTGRTHKIEPGEYVNIQDGKLVDLSDRPTHIVEACSGSITTSRKLHVRDLETSEQSIIKV